MHSGGEIVEGIYERNENETLQDIVAQLNQRLEEAERTIVRLPLSTDFCLVSNWD
jgi:hypothetical protein